MRGIRGVSRVDKVEVQGNFYDVLGVDPGTSLDAIRESYRRLMQQAGNHPDLGGDARTAAMINKAYAVLKDPEQRRDYDMRLEVLRQVSVGFAGNPGQHPQDPSNACLFCQRPLENGVADTPDAGCDHCGSPLGTPRELDFNKDGQRAVRRVNKQLNLMFFTHWQQRRGFAAKMEDLSPRGLRMVTRSDVSAGQRIRLISDVVDAVGEVTHCVPRHFRWRTENVAGVAFLTLRFARSAGGFVSRHV